MLRPVKPGDIWYEHSNFAIDAFSPEELGDICGLVLHWLGSLSRGQSVRREKTVKFGDAEFEALRESDKAHVLVERSDGGVAHR